MWHMMCCYKKFGLKALQTGVANYNISGSNQRCSILALLKLDCGWLASVLFGKFDLVYIAIQNHIITAQ